MRATMAYFAGAGTIIAAIAAGLGGGLLMANIMNPHEVREASKLERRAALQQAQQSPQPNSQQGTPSNLTASTAPQTPAPYQAATQRAATAPVVVAPAPASSPQPSTKSADQPAAREPASPPDNAYARARDADVKRQAAEQRRAERRQQWATRRQQREQELRELEQKVREDSDSREIIVQRDDSDRSRNVDGPTRVEFPHINLFGPD